MTLSWLVATLLIPPFFLTALAVFILRKRSSRDGLEVVVLLLAVALWGTTSAFEKLVVDLELKVMIAQLQFVGIVAVGPTCVAVALAARGLSLQLRRRALTLISLKLYPLESPAAVRQAS